MSAENIAKLLRDWAGDSARVTYPALREDLIKAAGWIDGLSTSNARVLEALESIRIYANDTLSGRIDGPDDREWQRQAVIEIRNRARAARAGHEQPAPTMTAEEMREAAASVEIEADISCQAEASNDFQEGYVVGFQDAHARKQIAIRAIPASPGKGAE